MALHVPLMVLVLIPLLPLLLPLGPFLLPATYRSPESSTTPPAAPFRPTLPPSRPNHLVSEERHIPHAVGPAMAAEARPTPLQTPRPAPPPRKPVLVPDLPQEGAASPTASAARASTLRGPPLVSPPVQAGAPGEVVASFGAATPPPPVQAGVPGEVVGSYGAASTPPPFPAGASGDGEVVTSSVELARVLSALGFHEMASAAAAMPPRATMPGTVTVFAAPDAFLHGCTATRLLLHLGIGHFPSSALVTARRLDIPSTSVGFCVKTSVKRGPVGISFRIYANGVVVSRPDLFNNGRYVVHGLHGSLPPLPCGPPRTMPRLSMKVGRGSRAGSRVNQHATGGGMGAAAAAALGVAGALAAMELGRRLARKEARRRRRSSFARFGRAIPHDPSLCHACFLSPSQWKVQCCNTCYCSACLCSSYLLNHSKIHRASIHAFCAGDGILLPVGVGAEMDTVHLRYAYTGAAAKRVDSMIEERRFFNIDDLMLRRPPRQLVVTQKVTGEATIRIAERFEPPEAIPFAMG